MKNLTFSNRICQLGKNMFFGDRNFCHICLKSLKTLVTEHKNSGKNSLEYNTSSENFLEKYFFLNPVKSCLNLVVYFDNARYQTKL